MISSPSPWRVSFEGDDRYMWQCLLYFIGLGLAPYPLHLTMPAAAAHQTTRPADRPTHPQAASGSSGGSGATVDVDALEGRGSETQEGSPVPPTRADFAGWVRRARERGPVLQADNVDLLFLLRGGGGGEGAGGKRGWVRGDGVAAGGGGVGGALRERASSGAARNQARRSATALGGGAGTIVAVSSRGGGVGGTSPGGEGHNVSPPEGVTAAAAASTAVRDNAFLEFVAPGKVEVRHEEVDEEGAVGEGQVLVEAICSSISSGTELKVRRGGRKTMERDGGSGVMIGRGLEGRGSIFCDRGAR